jgi:hypothetical protein
LDSGYDQYDEIVSTCICCFTDTLRIKNVNQPVTNNQKVFSKVLKGSTFLAFKTSLEREVKEKGRKRGY